MSTDINFDEDKYKIRSHSILGQPESPAVIRFMIKNNIVKNEKQAFLIVLIIISLFFLTSFYITYNTFFKQPEIPPVTDEIVDVM